MEISVTDMLLNLVLHQHLTFNFASLEKLQSVKKVQVDESKKLCFLEWQPNKSYRRIIS